MCDACEQSQVPIAELAVLGCGDRDETEPPTVERERGDCERAPQSDLVGTLDRIALFVRDDERLLRGEETVRRLVVEVHPGEAFAVEVRIPVGRMDPDLFSRRFLEPDRCARCTERSRRSLDDAADDLVHAFGGRDLSAELQQCRRALRLATSSFVEAGVLEGNRGVAGEHFQEANVVLVELVQAELRDHDDADDARSVRQRHDDLRFVDGVGAWKHPRELTVRCIGDEQRLAGLGNSAGDSLADLAGKDLQRFLSL